MSAPVNLAELERLAKAATPGPYRTNQWGDIMPDGSGDKLTVCGIAMPCGFVSDGHVGYANRDFIAAANPATILALVARLRRAEADMRLIAETDHIDAMLDPQRAIRVAQDFIASGVKP